MEALFSVTFEIEVSLDKNAKAFVASAPSLDIITQARTKERAIEAVRDAVALHVRIAIKKGILSETLQSWGVRPLPKSAIRRPPAIRPPARRVSVPVLATA